MKRTFDRAKDRAVLDLVDEHIYSILELVEGEAESDKSFILTFSRHGGLDGYDDYQLFFYDDTEWPEYINEMLLRTCDSNTKETRIGGPDA